MASIFDLQRIFRDLPGLFLVLLPDADATIVAASRDYLAATDSDEGIFGRPLFDALADDPDVGAHSAALRASLQAVVATRQRDVMPLQRRGPRRRDQPPQERHWSPSNAPILNAAGEVEFIVHHVIETAAQASHDAVDVRDVTRQKAMEIERAMLESDCEHQKRIYETALNSTPDFVYVFDVDHRALYANAALMRTWGVDDVRGKRWMDLGYEQWHADLHDREIEQVIATRSPIRGEIPFTGTNGRRIYDYIFAPVLDAAGKVVAVAGTTRDVTDRKADELALREQSARLAEADRSKDEFLATLAHELRNPLAPLLNAIELVRRAGAPSGAPGLHDVMERQVRHLVRLVDDLLEVSRVSRGAFVLRKERVDARVVVRNAVETSDALITSSQHRLHVDLPDEPLWLHGDEIRLAQVVANLLNNAALYTDPGGNIRVGVRPDGAHAVFSVADDGMGIAADALPGLFQMFSRADRNTARHQGGLGIGLALSRRLADMHEGTLEGRSDGKGKGSEFTMRIPLAAAADATAVAEAAQGISLDQPKVLVIDDNQDAADSTALLLAALNVDARAAYSGPEGLAVIESWQPSVVFLDIGMPGMNGYDVARAVRGLAGGDRVTLVALTGWGQDQDRLQTEGAGFQHHLVKPAQIDDLLKVLAAEQVLAAEHDRPAA